MSEATLFCSCGNPWIACAPGTSADAKTYPSDNVVDLFSWTDPVPMRLWCLDCMPVAEEREHG